MRSRAIAVIATATFAIIASACSSEPLVETDPNTYREQLSSACTEAFALRQALTEPTNSAEVTAFAGEVATALNNEADEARQLAVPGELDGDHRAFVQNTADQAAAWRALATIAPEDTDAFGALQTEILQLTLGRDELATEMGLEPCRTGSQ